MKKYIINAPQVISEETAGETVVINLETGSYYNLNNEATKLWQLLLNGLDMNEINAIISSEKIGEFVNKLLAESLIKESQTSSALTHKLDIDVNNLVLEVYTDMQDLLGLDPIHEAEPEIGWPAVKKS